MRIPGPLRPQMLPEARYADYFEMGYEPCVLKLFFGQQSGDESEQRLATGLVMSPAFAKAFLRHLQAQLTLYEADFGPIPDWYEEGAAKGAGA
jgi:hypothetical protein